MIYQGIVPGTIYSRHIIITHCTKIIKRGNSCIGFLLNLPMATFVYSLTPKTYVEATTPTTKTTDVPVSPDEAYICSDQ